MLENKFRKGTKWDPTAKALIGDPEQEKIDRTSDQNDEKRSMRIMAQMSSDILDCLVFTWDSTTCNENGKMPVLDCQMWIGLEKREKGIPKGLGEVPTVTELGELKKHSSIPVFQEVNGKQMPQLNEICTP